jgi:dTDP-L-rhamnose 4-epimerase
VFEDGGQRRDFVHVGDVARAVTAATAHVAPATAGATGIEGPAFEVYNVGSGTVRTIGELAVELARAYGGPEPVVTGQYRLGDVRHITASSARIQSEFGWAAQYDLTTGIADLLRGR